MKADKIVLIVGLLVVVVTAFVDIPQSALIITLLGFVGGWFVSQRENDARLRFMAAVLVLAVANGAAGSIPAIGGNLDAIFGNMSSWYNAGGLMVVVMGLVNYIKS